MHSEGQQSRTQKPAEVAADNLKIYFTRVRQPPADAAPEPSVAADLAMVLRGAFPALAPLEAVWILI